MAATLKAMLGGWLVPIVLALVLVGYHLMTIIPGGSWWLRVNRMTAFDAPAGASVVMEVDRELRRPFTADWRVLVRQWQDDGWLIVCLASGGGDYRPDAVLPSPLMLDWWTDGQCTHPPAGQLMISTVWTINTALPGVRTVVAESNVFRVSEVTE